MAIENRESLLILNKSFDTIMDETMTALKSTPISNIGPGGIARLILGIVNGQLDTFYKALQVQHTQAFLSKATGDTIDLIGEIVSCQRATNELDDDYKYRISKQALTLERANETAIRLAVLSVSGVTDVIMKEYTHGTGSFSVYPVLDDPYSWNVTLLNDVQAALKEARAYGTRAVILQPRLSYVELKARILFDKKASELDRVMIQNEATQTVRTYINGLKPGEKIEIHVIKDRVGTISPYVISTDIYQFLIQNKSMLIVDQEPSWNERYIEALNKDAIAFT